MLTDRHLRHCMLAVLTLLSLGLHARQPTCEKGGAGSFSAMHMHWPLESCIQHS